MEITPDILDLDEEALNKYLELNEEALSQYFTPEEKKEHVRCQEIEAEADQKLGSYELTHRCEFFKPWKWQRTIIEQILKCNILIVPAPNKIGKTILLINLANGFALGYYPWTKSRYEKPGYIKVNGSWYQPSPIKKPPVRIRITGEDWKSHIGETIIYEFERYAIKGTYVTKNNHEGVVCLITYANGSTIELMTYGSKIDLFESWTGDVWLPDEPSPAPVFQGMARGLSRPGCKIIMLISPLKAPWILNELIEPANKRYDTIVIDGLTFLDNESLVANDTALLRKGGALEGDIDEHFRMLLDYENKSKGEHVGLINAHLRKILDEYLFVEIVTNLEGLKRVNDTDEESRDARFKGIFKHLVGRVFKTYKDFYHPHGHLVKPFKIDTDWPVICEIDWHHSIPPFLGFYAWNKEGIIYVIKEIFITMTGEQVAQEIIRQKISNAWRLKKVYCDPLAKGNDKITNNTSQMSEDTFTTIKRILNKEGITIDTTGWEKTNKWTGHDRIKDRLSTSSGVPRIFIFDNCVEHRRAFKQLVYVDGVPSDEDDHPVETTYRAVLTKTKYLDPQIFKQKSKPDKGVI